MLGTGIEPARSCEHMVLNHARLPIPPPEPHLYPIKRVKIKIVFLMTQGFHNLYNGITARMAELVDAHGSGPCVRKDVLVQLQFQAL